MFCGEETEALWVCLYRDIGKSTKGIARRIEFLGKSWSTMHVVVLDAEKRQPLEHNTALAKQFRLNPSTLMVTNRAVVSIGMQTPWFAWYLRFTPRSIGSVKQPIMRTKKLFQPGVKPLTELFNELDLPDNIYVLQAQTSWLQELYQCLLLDKTGGDEVPGSDSEHEAVVRAIVSRHKTAHGRQIWGKGAICHTDDPMVRRGL